MGLRDVDDGSGPKVLGFFEPRTVHKVAARAPDKTKGEVFAGWSCAGGSVFEHTTTHTLRRRGRFGNARALSTTFTMPAGDVILKADYRKPEAGGK